MLTDIWLDGLHILSHLHRRSVVLLSRFAFSESVDSRNIDNSNLAGRNNVVEQSGSHLHNLVRKPMTVTAWFVKRNRRTNASVESFSAPDQPGCLVCGTAGVCNLKLKRSQPFTLSKVLLRRLAWRVTTLLRIFFEHLRRDVRHASTSGGMTAWHVC